MQKSEGPERILRTREVAKRLGVSRVSLHRWYTRGNFPAPRIIGNGATRPLHAWLESDVDAWLRSRPTVTVTSDGQS